MPKQCCYLNIICTRSDLFVHTKRELVWFRSLGRLSALKLFHLGHWSNSLKTYISFGLVSIPVRTLQWRARKNHQDPPDPQFRQLPHPRGPYCEEEDALSPRARAGIALARQHFVAGFWHIAAYQVN
jgi:hypothetical protein